MRCDISQLSHVRTLPSQILFNPSREVEVVREVDETHGERPEIPLKNDLFAVFFVLSYKAANSALG